MDYSLWGGYDVCVSYALFAHIMHSYGEETYDFKGSFAKETYDFKEPTHCSQPIGVHNVRK